MTWPPDAAAEAGLSNGADIDAIRGCAFLPRQRVMYHRRTDPSTTPPDAGTALH
jgi:hypothetical protein